MATLTDDEIEKIKAISAAISLRDWEKLHSLSDEPIPNFDIFLQYIDIFGETILPLEDGFEKSIMEIHIPNGDIHIEVYMRTEENNPSDIILAMIKSTSGTKRTLSVEYIFRS